MRNFSYILGLVLCICVTTFAQHPGLILTKTGVMQIKSSQHPPLFAKSVKNAKSLVDAAISQEIDVPVPKDMAGGYSHEKHKTNYKEMLYAGALYQITGEDKYAEFVRTMLLEYTRLFPTLGKHPAEKSYSRGKLFWQCLNDANWLVYTSQAYDAVYDYIPEAERDLMEQDLFRPYADFVSTENPQFFNRVHNHSTWGNAAVGMIGLVMNDKELVNRALYGLPLDKNAALAKDNDGGFIYEAGKAKAGFFAQMDYAFSPDGYYTEGPYYQRYAMLPFMVFAQALNNKRPNLKIFEYRNGLLPKAVKALFYQTNAVGEFFPINDAQKGMSINAGSVITAINIAYGATGDQAFVAAASMQGEVLLDQNGFALAQEVEKNPNQKFKKESVELTDGKDGTEGALGILRSGAGADEMNVCYKYTGQGLGHGHFDKLSYSFYDGSTEVLQDYGAARWVNIDQKAGGRYLPENKTWSKQTIAHNALVVDGKSHFGGKYDIAVDKYSTPVYFNVSNPNLQVATAKESIAYEGVEMQRTLALWKDEEFEKPLLIDLMWIASDKNHTYELPFHHAGQIMDHSFEFEVNNPKVMGTAHGYQHVYQEAIGSLDKPMWQLGWYKDRKFYTITSTGNIGDEIVLARIGANDPNFNLRKDPFVIQRKKETSNTTFLSVVESHGAYSPVNEIPIQPYAKIQSIEIVEENNNEITFKISTKTKQWLFKANKQTGNLSKIKQ